MLVGRALAGWKVRSQSDGGGSEDGPGRDHGADWIGVSVQIAVSDTSHRDKLWRII